MEYTVIYSLFIDSWKMLIDQRSLKKLRFCVRDHWISRSRSSCDLLIKWRSWSRKKIAIDDQMIANHSCLGLYPRRFILIESVYKEKTQSRSATQAPLRNFWVSVKKSSSFLALMNSSLHSLTFKNGH